MISRFEAKNFKSLHDVQIDLERFTIFVGPNASGKSSILQAIDFLSDAFDTRNKEKKEASANRTVNASQGVDLKCTIGNIGYRFREANEKNVAKPPRGVASTIFYSPNIQSDQWMHWNDALATKQKHVMPASIVLRLESSKLVNSIPVAPLPQNQPIPVEMAPNGSGLHTALANMSLTDPDTWQQLQQHLTRIVPSVERIRFTAISAKRFPSLLFDTIGAESLTAEQISEGTLLVLGLLAVLHSKNRPQLLLLDDLDHGLHPRAQTELIGLLRELLKANPELQILASTHSPYMLDSMEPHEVRMTILGGNRATICKSLVDHPDFDQWKEEMTPGELWSLFGEKWIIDEVQKQEVKA